jgi:hypothetical protein
MTPGKSDVLSGTRGLLIIKTLEATDRFILRSRHQTIYESVPDRLG